MSSQIKTVTVQIGNSDDRLSQERWSEFIDSVAGEINRWAGGQVHFTGYSNPTATWQNAAWVFNVPSDKASWLKYYLTKACREFSQDSIAWTEGETIFIRPDEQEQS